MDNHDRYLSQEDVNKAFAEACASNELDKVKYLLTSDKLSFHAQINNVDHQGVAPIVVAAQNNHTKIIKYLLSSSDLKEHANIHVNDDLTFFFALVYKNNDLLEFFIKDMNIQKTFYIEKFLNTYMNDFIEKLFIGQELNDELKNNSIEIRPFKL